MGIVGGFLIIVGIFDDQETWPSIALIAIGAMLVVADAVIQ